MYLTISFIRIRHLPFSNLVFELISAVCPVILTLLRAHLQNAAYLSVHFLRQVYIFCVFFSLVGYNLL